MRKLLLLVSTFAVACGGSDSSSGPAPGGPLAGTVGGRAFSPVEVRAVPAGSGATPCAVPILGNVGVRALALEVTSYANACGEFATSGCTSHPNAQSVTILVARLNPAGTEPTLSPGTYTINASPRQVSPDGATGMLIAAYAQSFDTTATCANPSVQGGTLRLDQVTGPVTGHVSLTFQGGSSLAGDFSAPICPGVTPDVCALATAPTLCGLPATCGP